MEQVEGEEPTGAKVRRDAGQRRLLFGACEEVGEAPYGEDRKVEGSALSLERGELGLDQPAATDHILSCVTDLLLGEGKHGWRRVDAGHDVTRPSQRQEHPRRAAGKVEHSRAGLLGELRVQTEVVAEGERVVEPRKSGIDPWLSRTEESRRRERLRGRRVSTHALLVPEPARPETLQGVTGGQGSGCQLGAKSSSGPSVRRVCPVPSARAT